MNSKLLERITPNDISIDNGFFDTPFQKSEKEGIARNIVIVERKLGGWKPFSWKDYQEKCTHDVTSEEKNILDEFVEEEVLFFDGEKYQPTGKFIAALADYIP